MSDHADTVREALEDLASVAMGHTQMEAAPSEVAEEAIAALDKLVAERDEARRHRDECERQLQVWIERTGAAEAERDRYKAALEQIAFTPLTRAAGLIPIPERDIARAALSVSGRGAS